MNYVLGLDVGISSVGWAVVNVDLNRIEDLGVRCFNAAEEPKTGAPLAEGRRLARSARRRLRRRAGRLRRARELFARYGLLPNATDLKPFETAPGKPDPWQLRAEGLDRLLTGEEFARALFHIAKRRGFRSNRKPVEADSSKKADAEEGVLLSSVAANRERLEATPYRTPGEMLACSPEYTQKKRNRDGEYTNTLGRQDLEEEIHALFDAQRRQGSQFASGELEREFVDVFAWQMPFASGDIILEKVGRCTFEQDEKRAPRASWTAEQFNLLGKLNTIRLATNGHERPLTPEEKKSIREKALAAQKVSYTQARKLLELSDDTRFKGLTYSVRNNGSVEESTKCESAAICQLTGWHTLRKTLEPAGQWDEVKDDPDTLDTLAFALTFYKTPEDIRECLEEKGIAEAVIASVENGPGFSKVLHLSTKAMRRILPHLEQGLVYSDACEAAGYNHSSPHAASGNGKLPPIDQDQIRNPVVLRALSQSRKVINAVVRKHGAPWRVHIELARDVSRSRKARDERSRDIENNRQAAQEASDRISEDFGRVASGEDRAKYRLYREQNGQCAYSQKRIEIERLFEPGYAEIDHILPYSRCFDDSQANKALVLCAENRNKSGRTPHEYFGHNPERWERYEAWVAATFRQNWKKRNNLLMRDFTAKEEEWKQRSLTDTQWIARYLRGYIAQNLAFADPELKQKVVCVNGRVTSLARGLWGLGKNREENDLHHAADAVVVAAMTQRTVQRITLYNQAQEKNWTAEILDPETGELFQSVRGRRFDFPEPWPDFRREVLARLSEDPAARIAALELASYQEPPPLKPVLVSRMPQRGVTGAIHAETIRSLRQDEGRQVSVIRKRLQDLKLTDMEKLVDPGNNRKLYAAIRARLEEYGGDGKKAFAEPLYKPTNSGEQGPPVKSVKLQETQPSGLKVRGGIAENRSMVRTDVFRKDGRYYLVPVYVSHIMEGRLPDRAIVAHKPEDEWPVMDESFEFLFTLQPYDFVEIENRKGLYRGYYRGTDRNGGQLELSAPNDNDRKIRGLGARTAGRIQKYQVSVLGDVSPVAREVRCGVADSPDIQPGEAEH